MIDLQNEAIKLQKLKEAMTHIESDITLSMHHWSVELDIPVSDLQKAWARHNFNKRKEANETKITATATE